MENKNKISVVLVDDHQIVLDGLKSLLETDQDFVILASLHSAEEAIEFIKKNQPSILLTDFNLPGMTGVELTRLVKNTWPEIKVAILSMHDEASVVKAALKESVDGYLLKNIQQVELRNALKQIMSGMPYVSPEVTRLMMSGLKQPTEQTSLLTARELEILKLIAQENSNKQIAEKLYISERTVETHRKNIFKKTRTSSLVGLIKFAFAHNLI